MSEPFMLVKAADISVSALGKATSVVIKGLLVLGVVAAVGWGIYVVLIKPHTNPTPTTSQQAQTIVNNYYYQIPMRRTFGLAVTLWGGDIGYVKYTYSEPVLVKKETISK